MYELFLRRIKNKNIFLFVLTFFTVFFSCVLARTSNEYAGLLAITISLVPLVQIMNKLIEIEEIKEEKFIQKNLFIRHKEFILNYFSIFFGAVLGFYLSYIFFPDMFLLQKKAIEDIRIEIMTLAKGSYLEKEAIFSYILINNMKVLLLFFLFSFIFGAGAIYLLLWNASIIGVFLGIKAEEHLGNILIKYILHPLYKLILLLPHGFFEFLAYFLAALSGGIVSIALIKNLDKEKLERILADSILLFVFSIIFLVIGAFIEAYF